MPYADVGETRVRIAGAPGGLSVYSFAWVADSNGDCVLNGVAVEGVIERAWSDFTKAGLAGGFGQHSAELLDPFDADALDGRCTSLVDNAATTVNIYREVDASSNLPIHVLGLHTFRVSATDADDSGVFKLYVRAPGSFERWGD